MPLRCLHHCMMAPNRQKKSCRRFNRKDFETQGDFLAKSTSKSCAKAPITEDYASLPRQVEVEARAVAAPIKSLMRRTGKDIAGRRLRA